MAFGFDIFNKLLRCQQHETFSRELSVFSGNFYFANIVIYTKKLY